MGLNRLKGEQAVDQEPYYNMEKRNLKWLKDFKSVYKPSKSFLNYMNNALQKEYSVITGREFDVLYLFAERPSDLVYLPTEYAAVLKASIEVQRKSYWGNCVIGWRSKKMAHVVKPEDEIEEDEVEFKWVELALPVIPKQSSVRPALSERLGLALNYELTSDGGTDSQDLELYVKLVDPIVVKEINQQLITLQAAWNEQTDQDITRQRGYIHWLSFERHEESKYVFRMDVGSAGVEGLKLVLNELNNPMWGIQEVEIVYI